MAGATWQRTSSQVPSNTCDCEASDRPSLCWWSSCGRFAHMPGRTTYMWAPTTAPTTMRQHYFAIWPGCNWEQATQHACGTQGLILSKFTVWFEEGSASARRSTLLGLARMAAHHVGPTTALDCADTIARSRSLLGFERVYYWIGPQPDLRSGWSRRDGGRVI